MQRILIFAIGLLVLVVLFAPSLDKLALTGAAPAPGGAPATSIAGAPALAGNGATIERGPGGQFHVEALVNDRPITLLVDTGSDSMALSEADAQTVGLAPDPASYRAVVTTASGPGYGAHVRIDRLEIAGHDLGAADAVVVRGLTISLLGRSQLQRLGPVSMAGDRMVIGN